MCAGFDLGLVQGARDKRLKWAVEVAHGCGENTTNKQTWTVRNIDVFASYGQQTVHEQFF